MQDKMPQKAVQLKNTKRGLTLEKDHTQTLENKLTIFKIKLEHKIKKVKGEKD